jgi:hypothetical protein
VEFEETERHGIVHYRQAVRRSGRGSYSWIAQRNLALF